MNWETANAISTIHTSIKNLASAAMTLREAMEHATNDTIPYIGTVTLIENELHSIGSKLNELNEPDW